MSLFVYFIIGFFIPDIIQIIFKKEIGTSGNLIYSFLLAFLVVSILTNFGV